MSEFRSRWLEAEPETLRDRTDRTDKSPDTRLACSECGRRLSLTESQAIGRCIRCQSEAEFVDTLARLKIHQERTKRAVAARIQKLEGTHGRS